MPNYDLEMAESVIAARDLEIDALTAELRNNKDTIDHLDHEMERLSSEGALKDAVIEAARQYLKLNEHYASVGKTQLRDAIAELDLVSEGLAPDA